ncbi:MAG: hypothetical protein WCO56_16185 [Verrucomicrobiota bacterium]
MNISKTCGVLALLSMSIVFAEAENNTLPLRIRTTPDPKVFTQPKILSELLKLSPEQLDQVDIAVINLLCAEGLRGSEKLDLDYCVRTLNSWAAHVESETKRNEHLFKEHPERFKNSLAYFRMAMLATVLVQDLRIQYNPERLKQLENGHAFRTDKDERDFFGSSKDVFLHGMLEPNHYGTCASMPFLYVAIGRRLGYPVTLATTASHYYVRYEEGDGKHLNVEATEHRAFLTPSDEEYKKPWEMQVSNDDITGFGYLRPLSNKEILGHALLTRATVLRSMKEYTGQAEAWSTAMRYLPDTPLWKNIANNMQWRAAEEGEQEKWDAKWDKLARLYVPPGPGYAYFQDKKIRLHLLMNYNRDSGKVDKAVKDFEDELRAFSKPFLESETGQMPPPEKPQSNLVLRYMVKRGKEVRIPADLLPPLKDGKVPLELSQRIAEKKLEDAELILAEFWTYHDEAIQAQHKAEQTITRQRMLQGGMGPMLIPRELVPEEYWNDIPAQLELRLSGLKTEQDVVNGIWEYHRRMEAQRELEQWVEKNEAKEQARRILDSHGIRLSSQNIRRGPQSYSPRLPPDPRQPKIPEMYAEWITPEMAWNLTANEISQLELNAKNIQIRKDMKAVMRSYSANGYHKPLGFVLVPASVLGMNVVAAPMPPTRANMPALPLSQPQPIRTMNGKIIP